MKTPFVLAALCVSTAIVFGSGSDSSTQDATAATTPTVATAAAVGAKVSANASQQELTAAFTAAGISRADRWAPEVTEYRPNPTGDPTFAALPDRGSPPMRSFGAASQAWRGRRARNRS